MNPQRVDEAYSALDFAVMRNWTDVVEVLIPHAKDPATLPSATVAALRASVPGAWIRHVELDEPLDTDAIAALVKLGLPKAGMSRWGLPIAHAAVLAGIPEVFDLLVDGDERLPADQAIADTQFSFDAVLNVPAGANLADMVRHVRGALVAGRATYAAASESVYLSGHDKCFWLPAIDVRLVGLAEIEKRLATRKIGATGATVAVRPQHPPIYDAMCELTGAAEVDRALAHDEPWLYVLRLAKALAIAPRLDALADTDVLAYVLTNRERTAKTPLLRDEARDWADDGSSLKNVFVVHPEDYPKSARKVLEAGRLVGMRGDRILCTSDTNGGDLWEIGTDKATNHGDTAKLVARMCKALAR
jgi:hypothetical protein